MNYALANTFQQEVAADETGAAAVAVTGPTTSKEKTAHQARGHIFALTSQPVTALAIRSDITPGHRIRMRRTTVHPTLVSSYVPCRVALTPNVIYMYAVQKLRGKQECECWRILSRSGGLPNVRQDARANAFHQISAEASEAWQDGDLQTVCRHNTIGTSNGVKK